ncbi:hypothetical protein Lal_00038609 [Lupinus albus]|nr:hypothetical protein Lal_00038609 [Lupinus albus]
MENANAANGNNERPNHPRRTLEVQSKIFHIIIQSVNHQQCHIYFLYGYGVTIPSLENFGCNIYQGSELADLLKQTKLIIWDEAPIAHKFCFEALDRRLTDLMGKVVIIGGDFTQILLVVPIEYHSDIVHATINSSYLWHQCRILSLTKNMCSQNNDNTYEIK